jgi:hypothetical protein
MRVLLLIGLVAFGLVGCDSSDDVSDSAVVDPQAGSGGGGGSEACNVTAPTACPSPAPTYEQDIKPIIEQRCLTCHSGDGMSELCPICWGLTSYQHVADWEDVIRGAMVACEMPPPNSGITMTNAERLKILEWLRCDLPE